MVGVDIKYWTYIGVNHVGMAQKCKCFYCGKFVAKAKFTRDHLKPKSLGNRLNMNVVMACKSCNWKKGARMPTERELQKARTIYAKLEAPVWAI